MSRSMPFVFTVGDAGSFASRFTLSAGYLRNQVLRPAALEVFQGQGGVVKGSVEADALGRFPDTVAVKLAVDANPKLGMVGFQRDFTVNRGPHGYFEFFDVPVPKALTVVATFPFVFSTDKEALIVQWRLRNGTSNSTQAGKFAITAAATTKQATPDTTELTFTLHPTLTNELEIFATGRFGGFLIKPFQKTFDAGKLVTLQFKPKTNATESELEVFPTMQS